MNTSKTHKTLQGNERFLKVSDFLVLYNFKILEQIEMNYNIFFKD